MNGYTRSMGCLGCACTALDCIGKAIGEVHQDLFSPQGLWAWWIIAAIWIIPSVRLGFGARN